eukprot:g15449.t1
MDPTDKGVKPSDLHVDTDDSSRTGKRKTNSKSSLTTPALHISHHPCMHQARRIPTQRPGPRRPLTRRDLECTPCSPANNATTSPLSLGNDHLSSHLIHTFCPHLATPLLGRISSSSDTEHHSGLESTGILIHLGTLIWDRTSPSSNTEHHFGFE